MSALAWYKRYPRDFIEGTIGLTLEEKGAYCLVLDLIYCRNAPIADDARYLAGICNVSLRKWKALRQALINAGKITVADGRISNSRADLEIDKTAAYMAGQTRAGRAGGRKSADMRAKSGEKLAETDAKLKDKSTELREKPLKNNVLSLGSLEESESESESEKKYPFFYPQKRLRPPAMLTRVLSNDCTAELIYYLKKMKKPLTEQFAEKLAEAFSSSVNICFLSPDNAAKFMMERGWKDFDPEWVNNYLRKGEDINGRFNEKKIAAVLASKKMRQCS